MTRIRPATSELGAWRAGGPIPYRLLVLGCRLVGRALGFRVTLEGREHLPVDANGRLVGGWIGAAMPHRTWIDPFVLMVLLPPELPFVWFADGLALARSWWRRALITRLIRVVPIWPGGGRLAFHGHLSAATSSLEAGDVFVLFPEVGAAVPVERMRRLSAGMGYFALRSDARIVPLVIGGGHELYLRRRIVLRVLPSLTTRQLLRLGPEDPLPAAGTSGERLAAHRIVDELTARTATTVVETHRAAEPRPRAPKRWRWLTDLFD